MPYKDPYDQYLNNIRYQTENKVKIKEHKREYYIENKEKVKKQNHESYLRNKESHAKNCANYYTLHKDAIKTKSTNYYVVNKASILEKRMAYRKNNLVIIKQRQKTYRENNKNLIKMSKRKEYEIQGWKRMVSAEQKLKIQAYAILGNKCARCGFDDPRALQIDHINGGGAMESKEIGLRRIRKKIVNGNTKDYQLLCANCNWIKRSEKGETGNRKGRKNRTKWAESNLDVPISIAQNLPLI